MDRKLLVLNVVLGGVSVFCIAFIVQHLVFAPPSAAPARPRPPAAPVGGVAPAPEAPRPPAQAYGVVATRNVFSPTRTEATAAFPGGGAALAGVKPNLYGVVLRDTNPIAYIEDPLTKRVAGYRLGDSIAGGTVATIAADRVVITRPEGEVDVRLRDPSKPRPAPPAPAAAPPARAAPGVSPVPTVPTPPGVLTPTLPPGVVPPRVQLQPPQVQTPSGPPPVSPFAPGLRPSPSLGRRLPAPPAGDAQPQQ